MSLDTSNNTIRPDTEEQEIDLKQLLEQYAYYWKWFIFAVFVTVFLAVLYLRYSTPQYKVEAKILLEKEDKAGGEMSGLAELSSLTGGGGQSAFVIDQIEVLKSRRILRKVIEQHNLQNSYYVKDNFIESEVLEAYSPLKVLVSKVKNLRVSGSLSIKILDKNTYALIEKNGVELENQQFGKSIQTEYGTLTVMPNYQMAAAVGHTAKVKLQSVDKTIDDLKKIVQVSPSTEKQSYIVNFSTTGPLKEKSEIIINSLVQQYNDDSSEDKNKVTEATSKFISARLELISDDLDSADKKVQDFKSDHRMTDLMAETELNLKTLTESEKDVLEKRTQVQLADYMKESIKSNSDLQLLPSNVGLEDQSIEKTLVEYNKLVLERDDLLKSSTRDNPVVKNLTENIQALNRNLMQSLDNYQSVLKLSLNNAEAKRNQLQGRVSAVPKQELGFKDISRQQQIVESIYLFLLQKREENEIKAAAQPDILKVIEEAYGSDVPVAPKKMIVLLGALIAGLLIPFVALYLKFLLDNKIQSRKDVEAVLSAPVLVEVPTSADPIVHDNDRSSLAEAFRILRTNITFMLGKKKDTAVIYVTSTTSGEGKSFVSTNLARILAMSGKKVVLIGADIRSPKVLDYLGLSHLQHTNVGITQYLVNPDMPLDNIVIKKPEGYQFDVIYSGYVAPNPAELLMNGHFDEVIEYAREHYDYVLVDTAPVSLVTDTLLIANNADLTIYVSRANYLDKRLLNVPKELIAQGKLKNVGLVINDVDFAKGYGYGYGYGYGDTGNKSWRQRLISKFKRKSN